MAEKGAKPNGKQAKKEADASNVKKSPKYERFGDTIRYLTWEEWQILLDSIDNYRHKLMIQMLYQLGCRVGEFVRIRLGHIDFARGRVVFPKENTKTYRRRVSFLSAGLANELKEWLRSKGRMRRRSEIPRNTMEYVFSPAKTFAWPYTENRMRQVFRHYVAASGLQRVYGVDSQNRRLHELTVHSLRHTHIMHFIHIHKLPIAVVQKQVGHTSLKTTSVYLNPNEEAVASAYRSTDEYPTPSPQSLNTTYSSSRYNDTRKKK